MIRRPTSSSQFLPDAVLAELKKKYSFAYQERMDETHSAVRFLYLLGNERGKRGYASCRYPEIVKRLIYSENLNENEYADQ